MGINRCPWLAGLRSNRHIPLGRFGNLCGHGPAPVLHSTYGLLSGLIRSSDLTLLDLHLEPSAQYCPSLHGYAGPDEPLGSGTAIPS